ncbi:hypothetical protein GCM10009430_37490 [Aquimarina litoralis]|uniref:DinB-like domain-containing protein n=1 Tax=Aquimarina litoralis TaxID=584605 RepID=A0ABP3UA86_9FLAO
MTETTNKLEQLLKKGMEYVEMISELELRAKESAEKWSKKEILGHLIDSGINNLQRFTEIQFANRPYKIKKYNQGALVLANDYQNSDTKEILELWNSINIRILNIIKAQKKETLNYKIELDQNNFSDLRFLMMDYVDHLEHHLEQIMNE